MISGAREARRSWLRRLVAGAISRELGAFVVPGPEVARASGLDLEAAGLRVEHTPRHASVLVVMGGLPEGLRRAATVAHAQMPRPRAVLAVGARDVSPLPGPDVLVDLDQGSLVSGVAELRHLFAEGTFVPEAEDFEATALLSRTEYACSMHPDSIQDEPGACLKCGMQLVPREAEDGGEGEDADCGHPEGSDEADESGDHEDRERHDHMNHGDMGFMSMVEMTQGTPRSSDGLQMEWIETPFGPLFPGLPGGLALIFTLDGDTVAEVEAGSTVRVDELPVGPVETFADRLARIDPLSPVAYRLLVCRAVENVADADVDERTALARVGALERERAADHLNWLANFARLLGDGWLERRAMKLQLDLLQANISEISRLQWETSKFLRRVGRTPLLRRKLEGVGYLSPSKAAEATGPVARAGGQAFDTRADDAIYQSLGFEPLVFEGSDALARLRVRLAEVERSLELVSKVGEVSAPDVSLKVSASGTGAVTVETPRGAATLRVTLEGGEVTTAELKTASARHVGLVDAVTGQREVADALVGVASLDISPWGVAG